MSYKLVVHSYQALSGASRAGASPYESQPHSCNQEDTSFWHSQCLCQPQPTICGGNCESMNFSIKLEFSADDNLLEGT